MLYVHLFVIPIFSFNMEVGMTLVLKSVGSTNVLHGRDRFPNMDRTTLFLHSQDNVLKWIENKTNDYNGRPNLEWDNEIKYF